MAQSSATEQSADRQPSIATVRRVERATGALATQTTQRMDERLEWFRDMPAEQRSWVTLVAQAGIAGFVAWLRDPARRTEVSGEVFGAAPRELLRAITLHQTVELVRLTVDVVESEVPALAGPGDEASLREAILRYSREVAFAAAEIYAQTAEARGAWDARLEALVVDALLRGEQDQSLASRVAALGWRSPASVSVLVGTPRGHDAQTIIDGVHRAARRSDSDVLAGVHGVRLVVIIGGAADPMPTARAMLAEFGPGPVVLGTVVPDLSRAADSAKAAMSGLRAAVVWPDAPRPVSSDELLPERAIAGDAEAQTQLVEDIYRSLVSAGGSLLETVATYLEQAGSLEGTARLLFVHPNTVRYRLRKALDVCGRDATNPRDAFALQLALAFGRLVEADGGDLARTH
ncbi:fatty acid biosynthesis transcriptional regulator FasR [Acidothermaceae bacterium B102]|nr:fatty acid biosynthesis transcriptional regulator FasR [Acidothermaceae bacterium B102]